MLSKIEARQFTALLIFTCISLASSFGGEAAISLIVPLLAIVTLMVFWKSLLQITHERNVTDIAVFFLLSSVMASETLVPDLLRGGELVKVITVSCLVYAVIRILTAPPARPPTASILLVSAVIGVFQSVAAFVQIVTASPVTWRWSDARLPISETPLRAIGLISADSPNSLAIIVLLGLAGTTYIAIKLYRLNHAFLAGGAEIFSAVLWVGLFSAGSRNSLIMATISILMMLAIARKEIGFFPATILLIMPIIFGAAVFNAASPVSAIFQRLDNLENDPSTISRQVVLTETISRLDEIPLLGVGGNRESFFQFLNGGILTNDRLLSTHNYYLDVLIMHGWTALIALILLWFAPWAVLLSKFQHSLEQQLLAVSLLALLGTSLFDTHLTALDIGSIFFGMLAILSAEISHNSNSSRKLMKAK